MKLYFSFMTRSKPLLPGRQLKTSIFLRAVKSTSSKLLAVLSIAAIPLHSMAHNEHSIGSTEIEFYEIELEPNEKIKLKHLKIYAENKFHDDAGSIDNALPSPPQNITDESDFSLTSL